MLITLLPLSHLLASPPTTLPVFPDLDPSLQSTQKTDHRGSAAAPNNFTRNISYPTLEITLPDPQPNSRDATRGEQSRTTRPESPPPPTPALLICPGGAYVGVAIDKEGRSTAQWATSHGIAAILLAYRLPHPELTQNADPLPLQDARQSLQIIHDHAKDWNVDPTKVGIIGFSAGGHLASTLITHPNISSTKPTPSGVGPAFAILLYPVITMHDPVAHKGSRNRLLGDNPSPAQLDEYSSELHVTDQTPPTFLALAANDQVSPQNSLLFFAALQAHKVPAELHIFSTGGHGFGLGSPHTPPAQWPDLAITWLRTLKILPPSP